MRSIGECRIGKRGQPLRRKEWDGLLMGIGHYVANNFLRKSHTAGHGHFDQHKLKTSGVRLRYELLKRRKVLLINLPGAAVGSIAGLLKQRGRVSIPDQGTITL